MNLHRAAPAGAKGLLKFRTLDMNLQSLSEFKWLDLHLCPAVLTGSESLSKFKRPTDNHTHRCKERKRKKNKQKEKSPIFLSLLPLKNNKTVTKMVDTKPTQLMSDMQHGINI